MVAEYHQRSPRGKSIEVAVGVVVFAAILEAALDPFEPAGLAWLGLISGLATVGAVAGWYLSRDSAPVCLSRYSKENVRHTPLAGFFAVALLVSLVGFAVVITTANPPLATVVLFAATGLMALEKLFASTEEESTS